MINFKTNQLTKNLASSAVAIGFFAGISMISAPAQAAMIVCTGLPVVGPPAASTDCPSVALSDLLGVGMFYQVGDKRFDNWRTFISIGTGGAIAPTASEISVTGFQTAPGWFDLIFTSARWQVRANQTIDTAFEYDVTSLGTPITSVDLHLIGHAIVPNGLITVTETVDFLNPGGLGVNLLAQSIPPGPDFVETVLIPPQTKIGIAKDISLIGGSIVNPGNPLEPNQIKAALSTLGQSYHQSTPEPSSMLGLLVVGGLGLRLMRKQSKD